MRVVKIVGLLVTWLMVLAPGTVKAAEVSGTVDHEAEVGYPTTLCLPYDTGISNTAFRRELSVLRGANGGHYLIMYRLTFTDDSGATYMVLFVESDNSINFPDQSMWASHATWMIRQQGGGGGGELLVGTEQLLERFNGTQWEAIHNGASYHAPCYPNAGGFPEGPHVG